MTQTQAKKAFEIEMFREEDLTSPRLLEALEIAASLGKQFKADVTNPTSAAASLVILLHYMGAPSTFEAAVKKKLEELS